MPAEIALPAAPVVDAEFAASCAEVGDGAFTSDVDVGPVAPVVGVESVPSDVDADAVARAVDAGSSVSVVDVDSVPAAVVVVVAVVVVASVVDAGLAAFTVVERGEEFVAAAVAVADVAPVSDAPCAEDSDNVASVVPSEAVAVTVWLTPVAIF